MAITLEQIHATAGQLHDQGIKPTLAEVRKALGGGSFTTISEAMKSWRQEHQDEQQLQQVTLPSGITDRLHTLGADVWQTAIDMASDRLLKEREALEVIKAKSQAETDEAQEAVKTLETEQAELLSQMDVLTQEVKSAQDNAARAKQELDKVTLQGKEDVNAIEKQLSNKQHQLDWQQERADTAAATVSELSTKLDDTSALLMQSREEIATYKTTNGAQATEIERLKVELVESKQQDKETRLELTERTVERDTANQQLATSNGKLEAITAQVQTLTTERDTLNNSNNNLNVIISKLEGKNEHLSESFAQVSSERDTLQGDNKRLNDALNVKPETQVI